MSSPTQCTLLPNGLPFPVQSETLTHAAMKIGTIEEEPEDDDHRREEEPPGRRLVTADPRFREPDQRPSHDSFTSGSSSWLRLRGPVGTTKPLVKRVARESPAAPH